MTALGAISHIAHAKLPHKSSFTQAALIYKHVLGSSMQVFWISESRGALKENSGAFGCDVGDAIRTRTLMRRQLPNKALWAPKCTPFAPRRESRRKVQILAVKTPPTRVPGGALSRVIHHRAQRAAATANQNKWTISTQRAACPPAAAACLLIHHYSLLTSSQHMFATFPKFWIQFHLFS